MPTVRSLPRIGISTYREPASWGEWQLPADLLPARYAAAVQGAGAVAVLLPPAPPDHAAVALDGVHGLIIAGGPDVDPARYGADRHPRTGAPRTDRDEWEAALITAALGRDLPLLAICRGLQLLNVTLGGTLIQHLPDVVGSDLHGPHQGGYGRHAVDLEPGSRLAASYGGPVDVATHHHQALDRLGDGLVPLGWTDDGIVEAVELPAATWTVGVQWHPEADDHDPLIGAFVAHCRAQQAGSSRPALHVLTRQ